MVGHINKEKNSKNYICRSKLGNIIFGNAIVLGKAKAGQKNKKIGRRFIDSKDASMK